MVLDTNCFSTGGIYIWWGRRNRVAWYHATHLGKEVSVSDRHCNYWHSMGNLAYPSLVYRRFLPAKCGISFLLDVGSIIEFPFGSDLQKDAMCFCLQCFSWSDKHASVRICNQVKYYVGSWLGYYVSIFHMVMVLGR